MWKVNCKHNSLFRNKGKKRPRGIADTRITAGTSTTIGFLILIFCILFPLAKMLTTGVYMLENRRWGKNKIIHFFAFESGKWSMADVLVLAVLMTYIGFNGIVNSTLSDLNMNNGTITSVTTNNTSIQPGYIIFVGFVVYSFTLSYILKNVSHFRHTIVIDKEKVE